MTILIFGGYFVNFKKVGTILELFFKFQGPNYKNWDRGLIYKKVHGLICISLRMVKSWNCF
jgi:hypothetical protein